MTISGSGTGTPGGIPEYSLLSDQTASASVLRTAMGIVKNLDTVSFTDVDKKALWKYDTSSSKPTLHPLEHVRVEIAPSRIDESWREIYQDLINNLPDDVKYAFKNSKSMPEETKRTLIVLGKLLEGTAKALNWIQNSINALDPSNPAAGPGSEIEARRAFNNGLVHFVIRGIIKDSYETFQAFKNELLNVDRNDPHFDQMTGILNQIGLSYKTILKYQSSEKGP